MQELRQIADLSLVETLGFPVTELVITGKPIRAKVDTADLPRILSISTRWHAQYCHESRTHYVKAKRNKISLHRAVMEPLPGFHVDHINHSGLDNRRKNLRVVTGAQNSANTRRRVGASGYRNVNIVRGQFRASVMVGGKRHIVGIFPTPQEAGRAAHGFREKAGLL